MGGGGEAEADEYELEDEPERDKPERDELRVELLDDERREEPWYALKVRWEDEDEL